MKPGAYKLSMADYLADPCPEPSLSSGAIKTLTIASPHHCWSEHPRLNPDHQRASAGIFDIGSAAHALLLEGEDSIAVIDADDWRTKAAKEQRDEAREAGKFPLLAKHNTDVRAMVEVAQAAILANPEIPSLHTGAAEEVVLWQEENGIWCRMRPDWRSHDWALILDYKTTGSSVNPYALTRMFQSMQFPIQAQFYRRGVQAVFKKRPQFVFLVQETSYPYACTFASLAPAYEGLADDQIAVAMALWESCLRNNDWPAYSTDVIHYIEPPAWAINDWMEKTEGAPEKPDARYLGA
jgi:hypothetical protein